MKVSDFEWVTRGAITTARISVWDVEIRPAAAGGCEWSAVARERGHGGGNGTAPTLAKAQRRALDAIEVLAGSKGRSTGTARGGSSVAGRGLEGAIEAQAAEDAAAGRGWLWRVPSPPAKGADARCRVVDFWGVMPGGRAVAIEAKEGSEPRFAPQRVAEEQAEVLRAVDAVGGLAGVIVEIRGRRWWVPWRELAPRIGESGGLGPEWMADHAVEIVGCDWITAAGQQVKGERQRRLV